MSFVPDKVVEGSALQRLGRRAMSLAMASALDYALQFLLPVVLVRYLEPTAFARYRLLWLVAGTVMAVVTQAMAGSLYYFLPRSDADAKRLYINQTLLYLITAGLIAAAAVSVLDPWLPASVRGLAHNAGLVPAFVLLWVVGSLLDLIGSTEERVAWQTRVTVTLSLVRSLALSTAAILTRQLEPVLWALLGFVVFKVALLFAYVARNHGLRGPFLRRSTFADQLRQSAPFGFAGALYGLRAQVDQWVATALFSLGAFAALSIAALLAPLVQICRQAVQQAFLPSISRLQAAGDLRGMLELNSRGSVMVAALVYPLLSFAFAFSDEIVTVVYTSAYVDAAPVMRIYIVGLLALVLELATVMLLLRQGRFSMRLAVAALIVSVAISWSGAHAFGLPGAALGSVTAIYLEQVATLWRISGETAIPVRRLQDWSSLAWLLWCSAFAALIAWSVVGYLPATSKPVLRVAVGGVLLAATYVALVAGVSAIRGWHPALEGVRRLLIRGAAP
jgi:O-antigen/teichoic acid export membrane protein